MNYWTTTTTWGDYEVVYFIRGQLWDFTKDGQKKALQQPHIEMKV